MQVIVLMSGSNTKFPLGFYSGNPNGNDATANAQFEEYYDNFVSVMGNARPQFMDSFVDFGQDPTQWAANASWSAWSWAQTGAAYVGPTSGTIPVIGVPLASSAGGWSNVDTFYQQIIAGNYDSAYAGIVDAWASHGYKTMDLRLGYEFNGNFMPWAPGNSSSPTANADFVKAWQHVADVLHAEGVKQGVTVNTVWNPADINYTSANVMSLYPGDKYVDIIGTDSYSPEYNLDSTNWQASNSGAIVSTSGTASAAQQAINNAHYWTYSNASQYNPVGQTGTGWSMQQAIELAKETGKPLGIAETGTAQDPAFPTWLAQELSQPGAPKVAFVNIWSTDQSDGKWGFINGENTAVGKAWSQAFGAGSASNANGPAVASAPLDIVPGDVGSVATAPSPIAFGSGADTVSLQLSEDAYQGDAQVSFSVDGVLLGTGTITASHASGQSQTVSLAGNWGAGQHTVTANFLNDAYAGTAATDRNAYVSAASYDGVASSGASLSLLSAGPQSLTVGTAIPSVVAVGAGAHTIALKVSEDAYQGDAQFTVSVDGTQVGGTLTAQASHAAGQDQTFDVAGNFADGTHTVSVNFLNDAYAGTPTTDRNLYVDGAGIDGVSQASGTLSLMSAGSRSLT
ncbi:MAG: carbohydrate-binding domain-containing protein, partial [Janthinobacterium lividum]